MAGTVCYESVLHDLPTSPKGVLLRDPFRAAVSDSFRAGGRLWK